MTKAKRIKWTLEEEQLLKEYSQKYTAKQIAKKMNKEYRAVLRKALSLNIKLKFTEEIWTEEKLDYLKNNVKKETMGKLSEHLGISAYKIRQKCEELNIEYGRAFWTEEEINVLRENAQKCHFSELVKVLPNRSIGSISAKAFELNIPTISQFHKLDKNIEMYVKENWGKISISEMARNLEISVSVVYRYKKELGLPDIGQISKKWNETLIEKLKSDALTMTRNELAKKYETTAEQISGIAAANGIKLIDSKKIWNDTLDKKLLELAKTDLSINEIADLMGMKANSIRIRLKKLDSNIYEIKIEKMWTDEKVQKLIKLCETETIENIAKELNMTEKQILNKVRSLKIKIESQTKNTWTEEETKILIKLSPIYERHLIAKVMERNESVIKDKARTLGIKLKLREYEAWSLVETQLLREYVQEFTAVEIAYLLERSEASIRGKLRAINLKAQSSPKFWSKNETDQLIELAKNYSEEEIAQIMNKSSNQIRAKLYNLGIKAKNIYNKYWTPEEEKKLKDLLEVYSTFDIAEILNRSEEAVVSRALKLGYEITYKNRRWTLEEEQKLAEMWGNYPIEEIAKQLDRTISAIINRTFKLNLGSQIENNYDGFVISELENIFCVTREIIITNWVTLGLKLSYRKRSDHNTYAYVTKENLLEFLEANQNIWNSNNLEIGLLGDEPEWLKQKRINDQESYKPYIMQKQQLIQANNYFLQLKKQQELESNGYRLELKKSDKGD